MDSQPLESLSRQDYLAAITLSVLTLAVYAFTAAPGVTLADSGDYINGVLTLGIVHPPGYPLYTVLGHLFSYLPLGDPAFRVNLFSALWGALCLGALFLNLRILSISPLHSAFASLSLGFTTVFWSKAVVAEVYTFNAFLLALIVFWILSYNRDKKTYQLYLTALSTGLALSNHYPLAILSGIGLVFLLDRRDLRPGDFFKSVLFLILGLTPYLYLFIQASNPELQYNFAKLSDFGMVIDHILRNQYPNAYGGTGWDKLLLAFTVLRTIVTNFLFASLFLLSGIISGFLQKRKCYYPLLLAALGPSLGLILTVTFTNDDEYKSYLTAYLIPTFLFLSVFLSIGLNTLMNRYVKKKVFQICLLLILLVTQIGFNFSSSSHHNNRLAEIWATEVLNSLKPDAVLIICVPGHFAIYHPHLIKGLRPDVTLYDRWSLLTKDNLYGQKLLYRNGPIEQAKLRKKYEQRLLNSSNRPIYYLCKHPIDEHNINFSYTPFVLRSDKRHLEASDATQFTLNDRLLDAVVNGYPKSEYWIDRLRRIIFSRLIAYYGGHSRPEVNRILDYLKKTKFYSQTPFILSLANNLYFYENHKLARSFYDRAEQLSPEAFSPTDLAVYCSLLANAKDFDKALGVCTRQGQRSRPCDDNTVTTRQTIAAIYKEKGQWSKVSQYARKILECQPDHNAARSYLELAKQKDN